METALRRIGLQAAAGVLEELLGPVGVGRRKEKVRCACGGTMDSRGLARRRIQTLLGVIAFERSVFACPRCARTRCPGDEELDILDTLYSPAVRRLAADFGSDAPFKRVSRQLRAAAALDISRKDCERIAESTGGAMEQWMAGERRAILLGEAPAPEEVARDIETLYIEADGTGVPMVPREVAGRKGKQSDGTARTREAKLGCVFTQTCLDERGRPIRDPRSTSYVGAIEEAPLFGRRLYAEAVRRGLYRARKTVYLGDGAEWVKNLAATQFPQAVVIVDLYHALQHVAALCRALFDRDLVRLNRHKDRWCEVLENGGVQDLVRQARELLPRDDRAMPDARREMAYFEKNIPHMRYDLFRAQGFFVGSGVIEAGCKSLIGQRMKQSGMEWTVEGANAIIALRCTIESSRDEEYYEARAS